MATPQAEPPDRRALEPRVPQAFPDNARIRAGLRLGLAILDELTRRTKMSQIDAARPQFRCRSVAGSPTEIVEMGPRVLEFWRARLR